MKRAPLFVVAATVLSVTAAAQPAPDGTAAGSGTPAGSVSSAGSGAAAGSGTAPGSERGSGAGAAAGSDAGEPAFEPEHVTAAKPAPPTAAKPAASEPITVDQLVIASTGRLDFNFFGDVSLLKADGEQPNFAIGPLGFQVTAHLAEGLVGRTEYAMMFEDGETVVDVERAFLEYRVGHWMFSAGRTHAELGYWNNAFHHGRWLQLTINRPRVIRFEDEGGMLQVHQVGVTAVYGPKRGDRGVEVALGIGNGHGPSIVDVQTLGDNNLAKSVLLRVGAVGVGHGALRFGINLGFDEIAPEPVTVRPLLPDTHLFEFITGVYGALRSDTWIAFGEVYNVFHRAAGRSWQITDGFLVGGYRFGPYIPYAQLEARHGDGLTDPFYNPDPMASPEAAIPGNYVEGILGMHYDLSTWSALKLELSGRRFQTQDSGSVSENDVSKNDYRVELNWSFGR